MLHLLEAIHPECKYTSPTYASQSRAINSPPHRGNDGCLGAIHSFFTSDTDNTFLLSHLHPNRGIMVRIGAVPKKALPRFVAPRRASNHACSRVHLMCHMAKVHETCAIESKFIRFLGNEVLAWCSCGRMLMEWKPQKNPNLKLPQAWSYSKKHRCTK